MRNALVSTAAAFALAACGGGLLAACGGSRDAGGPLDPGEPPIAGEVTGAVALSLTSVPGDASCLRVVATGTRVVARAFDLVPGAAASFTIDRLPLGIVLVDAQAYPSACAALGEGSQPSFTTEAPVPVRIDPVEVATVTLKLVRNARLAVAIDFEADPWISRDRTPTDIAVFGDAPYGAVQIADFPNLIASINAEPGISTVVHLGDIKNGSSRCDTSHFDFVARSFATFTRPLVYTPGDNEWTDCHRANNGAYDPLERLAVLRALFFPTPGLSLGRSPRQVMTQASLPAYAPFVENQLWLEAGVVFSAIHVVGSNNNALPWFGDDTTGTKKDDLVRRPVEVAARSAAGVAWLDKSFALAKAEAAAGVVVLMQADMWDGAPLDAFNATVAKLAEASAAFGKPVLLIEGDSHIYKTDKPLATGSAVHGVTTAAPNVTRLVVQGSTTTPLNEWVKLHIDAASPMPFSWTRVAR